MSAAIAWLIWLPLAASVLLFVMGPRKLSLGLALGALNVVPPLLLFAEVRRHGVQHYLLGWPAPLGIELRADALSASLVLLTAVVGAVVAAYAAAGLGERPAAHAMDPPSAFWPLWFVLAAGLHALYLSTDLFNLYVALELVTLAAIALVALPGTRATIAAALQYLLATLVGSLAFLFGVALLYASHGQLELFALGSLLTSGPLAWSAFGLMTAGIMVKGAFFPLHFWLPDAHGHALAPVSALLSGLVVKAGFYLLVRVWFDVFGSVLQPALGTAIGVLALLGIVWASLHALGAARLKRLLAYSTVAQLGLMLLLFPLVMAAGPPTTGAAASALPGWCGGVALALSHGLAKASLFLAAGAFIRAAGDDVLVELAGTARHLPLTALAFALGAWTLLGLPPSGGYLAKTLFEEAAARGTSAWGWVVQGTTLLSALYLAVALRALLERPRVGRRFRGVSPWMQLAPLVLAGLGASLGLLPLVAAGSAP